MTSVIVPVTRVPIGTASCPFTIRFDARVAWKGSPGLVVFDERSDESATVIGVPLGTCTRVGAGFAGTTFAGAALEATTTGFFAGTGFLASAAFFAAAFTAASFFA